MGGDFRSRFEYDPPVLRFDTGAVGALADELAEHGLERALVVCGSTVGSTPDVIESVTDGLGEKLGGVFAEATADERLETAVSGCRS